MLSFGSISSVDSFASIVKLVFSSSGCESTVILCSFILCSFILISICNELLSGHAIVIPNSELYSSIYIYINKKYFYFLYKISFKFSFNNHNNVAEYYYMYTKYISYYLKIYTMNS